MTNRIRAIEEKVQPVALALAEINVEEVANKHGVSASTLRYDLNKVERALPMILANENPGPKPQEKALKKKVDEEESERKKCVQCGGKMTKNGGYWVLNWIRLLLVGWMGEQWVRIQRYRCRECGYEDNSPERARQAVARQMWWQQVNRLVSLSRFKLHLSVRLTQTLVQSVYGRGVSIGHIDRLTKRIGTRAEIALTRLSRCRQALARFLMYDETYPKLKKRAYSLGVAICEHGLIRSVRCIVRKAKDIPAQLHDVVGEHFQPQYFLTDLDVKFNKYMRDAGLALTHLRDRVHLVRHIVRLFDEAVRDVSLHTPKGLPNKQRKQQKKLKQDLLCKRLRPILELVFKAFSPGYASVCVLLLEGVISQLQDPAYILQTASVQVLAKRLRRFVKKHSSAINTMLQLTFEQGTPSTTNALESINARFKPFSRIAKFFPSPQRCTSFFAAVALWENFDVKTRGPNRGASAMQRAEINLKDFGATDFFSAVGLSEPQISLAYITD